ncbi:MAG: DUF5719 family protein [Propionibacteriaceae bacterium]|jgi:hypothetical protein|nr:DUF5719 family protein [Propionibacteriaceae bacterium]
MKKIVGFIAALVVVAALIAYSVFFPQAQLATGQIGLPATRLLACPVGDPALGTSTVRVADGADFTAGVLNEIPAEPTTALSVDNPAKSIVVRGSATVGGVSTYVETSDPSVDLAAPCAPPITSGTWSAVDLTKQTATLMLTSVDASAAVVDVFLYSQSGPVMAPGLSDITLASGQTQLLSINSLVTSDTPVAVALRASKGRVAAVMRTLGGSESTWQLPQVTSASEVILAGIPAGDGPRVLAVTNTDTLKTANVKMEVLGQNGSFVALGLDSLQILPGRAMSWDITGALGGQASAVRLTSDVPVSASVTLAQGDDSAAVSGQEPLGGAIVMPPIGGTAWFANPTSGPAAVKVSFEDALGASQSVELVVQPTSIASVEFPATGSAVRVESDVSDLRASVVLSDPSVAVLPLVSGGADITVDEPRLDPGMG